VATVESTGHDNVQNQAEAGWSRGDTVAAASWFVAGIAARAPLVARIEGALDHDQSVVGLMALDIAALRRFPIFFDGQRYMGAFEAYLAAFFDRVFGPGPTTVALAPLLFFGLFVAGQYAVWRLWQGRTLAHLAALITVVGSPMLALWGVIPRGGYIEVMAWALPTLAVYRAVVREGSPGLTPVRQAGWGFLLAVGYLINPLSLVVYCTIAIDWTFHRHGADLRRERAGTWPWLDRHSAPFVWLAIGLGWLSLLAFCVHVDPRSTVGSLYLFGDGLLQGRAGAVLGTLGAVACLGVAEWWTRGPARLFRELTRNPWALVGIWTAASPFVAFWALVRLRIIEAAPTLPVWIAAPWKAGPNIRNGFAALGPLVGCDPRAVETVLIGQGVEPPPLPRPELADAILGLSPCVVALVAFLVVLVAWRSRDFVVRLGALRGTTPASPSGLALTYLAMTVVLYSLQGTSPNASSIRYLVPVWVVLPGLLALGLGALPLRSAAVAGAFLLVSWGVAQWSVWESMDRPCPVRPLAGQLQRSGVKAIVAPTPIALLVANLTEGRVGALEYLPIWPRLGRRYRSRFDPARPVVCITDRQFPWAIRGQGAWDAEVDFERHLRGLSERHPGHVRHTGELGHFDLWEVDLDLDEILAPEPDPPSPGNMTSTDPRR
jgi:hypothetical protein